MLVSLDCALGRAMFQILLQIGYSDADIGFLMVHTIESKLLEQPYDFILGTFPYHDVPADVEQNMLQTSFAKQAANVRAPVLPFSVQGRNKHRVGVNLKRSLAELLGTVTGTQVEDLKSGFLQRQLHNSIADDVDVVPNDTNDDSPSISAHFPTRQTWTEPDSTAGCCVPSRSKAACLMAFRSSFPALPVIGKPSKCIR